MAAVIRNKAAKKKLLKYIICFIICLAVVIVSFSFLAASVSAESSITLDISSGEADENSSVLDILFLLAFLALIPSFLLMMTSFVRIIIALSFLRNAIGTQTSPPNQVLIGLALFLSLFIMFPVLKEIKQDAYDPYKSGEITMEEAIAEGSRPLKTFMLKQVYEADLDMFMSLADSRGIIDSSEYTSQEDLQNLSLAVVVPSFITSELKRAFLIGFLLYIPFLLIDLIVSSTLMSMGMVMLPPTTISLPFKLMLFIVVDGWNLLFESLIISFRYEQTLTFVPKILVLAVMLLVLGSWMMTTFSEFFNQIFDMIAGI
jgi:flagellar biosynthetic protein FliP